MDEDEYAGAPPRMVIAEQTADAMEEAAAALSLEERFAAITAELMRDEVEVPQALLAFKEASAAHVDQLRCGGRAARRRTRARPCGPSSTRLLRRDRRALPP